MLPTPKFLELMGSISVLRRCRGIEYFGEEQSFKVQFWGQNSDGFGVGECLSDFAPHFSKFS
jgi:hypothetical protein